MTRTRQVVVEMDDYVSGEGLSEDEALANMPKLKVQTIRHLKLL